MKNKKGFTIIELIVVIAIIAILAAIVMVNVTQYIEKSKKAAALAEARQIPIIATQYFAENGTYKGLYADPKIATINSAIKNINSNYYLTEQDEGGYIDQSGVHPMLYPTGAGKWVAVVRVLPTYTYIGCADSTGYVGVSNRSGMACAY